MAGFVVGVTGGVASGKSVVTSLFSSLGVVIADADLAARAVVAPGQPALAAIARHFGPDFLLVNGMLNRPRMRSLVFSDERARRDLESITHPMIRELLREQCTQAASPYVVAAIPLLAEPGVLATYGWLDRRLVVDCMDSVQLARLLSRDAIDETLALSMIRAQAPRNARLRIATDVIENDASIADLAMAVRRLDLVYREAAADASRSMD